jgi:CheY-like chemotaxis protein
VARLIQAVEDWKPMGDLSQSARKSLEEESSEEFGAPFSAPGYRVLIVCDQKENQAILESMLLIYGLDVRSLSLASQLEEDIGEEYGLIFIDEVVEGRSGAYLLETVRAKCRERGHKLPTLVALAAGEGCEIQDMVISQGFDDYLSKPISSHRLRQILERFVPDGERWETGHVDS